MTGDPRESAEQQRDLEQIKARAQHVFDSVPAPIRARITDLERRQTLAIVPLRTVLQMLDAANGGAEVIAPLLHAKVTEALQLLELQDAKPLQAEGVHPHLVKRVQRRDDNVIGGDDGDAGGAA